MYSLPKHKISGELKSCNSFWMYPPLWTSLLVARHDEIENTSIGLCRLVELAMVLIVERAMGQTVAFLASSCTSGFMLPVLDDHI